MFSTTAPVNVPVPIPAPSPAPSYCAVLTVFHIGSWAPPLLTGRQSRSPRWGVRDTPKTIGGKVWLTIIVSLLQSPIKGAATSTSSNSILNRNNITEMNANLNINTLLLKCTFYWAGCSCYKSLFGVMIMVQWTLLLFYDQNKWNNRSEWASFTDLPTSSPVPCLDRLNDNIGFGLNIVVWDFFCLWSFSFFFSISWPCSCFCSYSFSCGTDLNWQMLASHLLMLTMHMPAGAGAG